MMNRISSIAVNTFRESVREKLLYIVILYGGILLLSTFILSPLSVGAAGGKIITDVGLAGISLLGVLTAIMVGSTLVHKEVEKKAVFMVLTRPVSRHEYLVGKFSGMVMALGLLMVIMTAVMAVMIFIGRGMPGLPVFLAAYLSLLEMAVMSSIVIFFSTFTTPILTSFFSVCIFVAGNLSGDLRAFAQKFGGAFVGYFMEVFYYLLPNLKVFNLRNEAVHDLRFHGSDIALATIYAAVYCGAILYFAYLVFRRREFS
jgi:Cu-processing system permease protein